MNSLIVVSGGDAPGINAFLHAYTRLATAAGHAVSGANGGLPAVLSGQIVPLSVAALAPLAGLAGSYLMSSREPVLAQPGARERLRAVLDRHRIDHLILLGGNGTLHHVLPRLVDWGVPCVGVPVTIDNDVPGTHYSLGFESACQYAVQAVDGARATASALPGRVFMIETLGGDTGLLALAVAVAALADAVIVPEYAYDEAWLAERLKGAMARHGYALLVLSEGVRESRTLADRLPQSVGVRVRDIRLGHGQRGGTPAHRDRWIAVTLAHMAYRAACEGRSGVLLMDAGGEWALHAGTLAGLPAPLPDRALYDQLNGLPGG